MSHMKYATQNIRPHVLIAQLLSVIGRLASSVAGPTVWNSLPEYIRDPDCSADTYGQSLKTFLF